MTREDAVTTLKDISEMVHKQKEIEKSTLYGILDSNNEPVEALDMAIKALEQESCEDCISRAEAIDALGYDISIESDEGLDAYKTVIKEMLCKIYDVQKENIEKLPSIKPKTDVLDKIRAEIEQVRTIMDEEIENHDRKDLINFVNGLNQSLMIIDKYKAESEE